MNPENRESTAAAPQIPRRARLPALAPTVGCAGRHSVAHVHVAMYELAIRRRVRTTMAAGRDGAMVEEPTRICSS